MENWPLLLLSRCTYLGKPKRWQIQAILMIPTNHFENWKKGRKNALKLDALKKCKIVHIICIGFMYKMEWHGHLVHQNPVRRSFGYQTCRHSQHPFFLGKMVYFEHRRRSSFEPQKSGEKLHSNRCSDDDRFTLEVHLPNVNAPFNSRWKNACCTTMAPFDP